MRVHLVLNELIDLRLDSPLHGVPHADPDDPDDGSEAANQHQPDELALLEKVLFLRGPVNVFGKEVFAEIGLARKLRANRPYDGPQLQVFLIQLLVNEERGEDVVELGRHRAPAVVQHMIDGLAPVEGGVVRVEFLAFLNRLPRGFSDVFGLEGLHSTGEIPLEIFRAEVLHTDLVAGDVGKPAVQVLQDALRVVEETDLPDAFVEQGLRASPVSFWNAVFPRGVAERGSDPLAKRGVVEELVDDVQGNTAAEALENLLEIEQKSVRIFVENAQPEIQFDIEGLGPSQRGLDSDLQIREFPGEISQQKSVFFRH